MSSKRKTPLNLQRAAALRHHPTDTEAKLWTYLRFHSLDNVHFRRQHAIGKYIVDFCAPRQKLIIELDGSQHLESEEIDKERAAYLTSKGYRMLRFWNDEVSNDLNAVIATIEQALHDLT